MAKSDKKVNHNSLSIIKKMPPNLSKINSCPSPLPIYSAELPNTDKIIMTPKFPNLNTVTPPKSVAGVPRSNSSNYQRNTYQS